VQKLFFISITQYTFIYNLNSLHFSIYSIKSNIGGFLLFIKKKNWDKSNIQFSVFTEIFFKLQIIEKKWMDSSVTVLLPKLDKRALTPLLYTYTTLLVQKIDLKV